MKMTHKIPNHPPQEGPLNPLGMFPIDPMGSYTGNPLLPWETPVQDADDL